MTAWSERVFRKRDPELATSRARLRGQRATFAKALSGVLPSP
jgi:hypothetical protein